MFDIFDETSGEQFWKRHWQDGDTDESFEMLESPYEKFLKEFFNKLRIPTNNWTDVFDGGCGYGASTLALGRVLPREVRIWTTSVGQNLKPEVIEELGKDRIKQANNYVDEYLSNTSQQFDLVHLARVDFTGIEGENGYKQLADHVKPYGLVITQGSTQLQDDLMAKHFQKFEIPKDVIGITPHAWKKI